MDKKIHVDMQHIKEENFIKFFRPYSWDGNNVKFQITFPEMDLTVQGKAELSFPTSEQNENNLSNQNRIKDGLILPEANLAHDQQTTHAALHTEQSESTIANASKPQVIDLDNFSGLSHSETQTANESSEPTTNSIQINPASHVESIQHDDIVLSDSLINKRTAVDTTAAEGIAIESAEHPIQYETTIADSQKPEPDLHIAESHNAKLEHDQATEPEQTNGIVAEEKPPEPIIATESSIVEESQAVDPYLHIEEKQRVNTATTQPLELEQSSDIEKVALETHSLQSDSEPVIDSSNVEAAHEQQSVAEPEVEHFDSLDEIETVVVSTTVTAKEEDDVYDSALSELEHIASESNEHEAYNEPASITFANQNTERLLQGELDVLSTQHIDITLAEPLENHIDRQLQDELSAMLQQTSQTESTSLDAEHDGDEIHHIEQEEDGDLEKIFNMYQNIFNTYK